MSGQFRGQVEDALNGSLVPGAGQIFPGGTPPGKESAVVGRRSDAGLTVDEKGSVVFKTYSLTSTGLKVSGDLTLEQWENILKTAGQVYTSLAWIVGDAMLYGHRRFGKDGEDVAKLVGRSPKTIQNWTSICAGIDFSRRREKLHFSIHAIVASMEPELQDQWLDYAQENRLSRRKLELAIEEWRGGNGGNDGSSPLADKSHRKIFNRIWRDLSAGKTPSKDQITHLRRWLDQIERGS